MNNFDHATLSVAVQLLIYLTFIWWVRQKKIAASHRLLSLVFKFHKLLPLNLIHLPTQYVCFSLMGSRPSLGRILKTRQVSQALGHHQSHLAQSTLFLTF